MYKAQITLSSSKHTVDAFIHDVTAFVNHLTLTGLRRLGSVKKAHINRYLSQCLEEGKQSSSVNRYLVSIRSFCKFLRREGILKDNITEDIPRMMQKTKAPHVPTREEIELLLEQPDVTTMIGLRDKAMLELLYSSGLRASELCDLKLTDFRENQVIIDCGKGNKTRCVPVTETAKHWIEQYIQKGRTGDSYAEIHNGRLTQSLFITEAGASIKRQLVTVKVMSYAKKAGLSDITAHTLRHACATHLLDQGADLRFIQELLGHAFISSTVIYTHLSSGSMQRMFHQFHPRRKEVVCLG